MKTLIANTADVAALLPMHECIEVMADALKLLAGGDALLPLRQMMLLPGDSGNLMGLMPSYLGGINPSASRSSPRFPPTTAPSTTRTRAW